ncbi:hypothetical protein [Janthinobacterium sp. UMAB-56]|uniref:hypothetical protein n=1 Tax=Janthinobacterium sp. UMAB-56 TaxID=1365361 RepID=UPI001C5722B9|nr:hypothetical protein [Janthinobacterium sp. UMAB-56]
MTRRNIFFAARRMTEKIVNHGKNGHVSVVMAKKKPAGESGLKTIFLEENSGDSCIMLRRTICV